MMIYLACSTWCYIVKGGGVMGKTEDCYEENTIDSAQGDQVTRVPDMLLWRNFCCELVCMVVIFYSDYF